MQPAPNARDNAIPVAGIRLRFIDMARSIAILLMLEGHFVDLSLAEDGRRPGWWPYDVWHYVRGLTAPIFFMVTGLVFAFLLCKHDGESGFLKLTRVRKGVIRALELLFWGYAIQLDMRRLPDYLRGDFGTWPFAFHVLQCIGIGLLLMIALYGLRRRMRVVASWVWFLGGGILVYLIGLWLAALPSASGFPVGAPDWLRNPFKGPHSVFPVAPWLAFTLYGAAAGALLRHYESRVRGFLFPALFIGTGGFLLVFGWYLDLALASAMSWALGPDAVRPAAWFHLRAGGALVFIGLLMAWENRFGIRESRFLVIGRNTFPIYVIHVIVLYGGLIGYGLKHVLRESLTFGQAIFGAFLFMAAFAILAQCVAPFNAWIRRMAGQKSR